MTPGDTVPPIHARTVDATMPDWGPAQGPPVDQERVDNVYAFELGAVVRDADERRWVFIGWRENTAGRTAWFTREVMGYERGDPISYGVAIAATLERKFPRAVRQRR